MLSKKDEEKIRKIIKDEIKEALNRKITIERGPRKHGDPEKVIKEEEWNILDFLAYYFPYMEGALRGVQADVDSSRNGVASLKTVNLQLVDKINGLGQFCMALEMPLKAIVDKTALPEKTQRTDK